MPLNQEIDYEMLDPDAFRDTIATVDEEGKRRWIFPKEPKGIYYTWRKRLSALLLTLFFVGPFLTIGGQPLFLFNILERKFILFGMIFWPQDFYLFALAMLTLFVFIVLFTVVYGRIWCGWVCPQTVFMEMVFRRIEYWIEGSAQQQKKLSEADWDMHKIGKRAAKWSIFALISLLIGHTVMAYLNGWQAVWDMLTHSPLANFGQFTFAMIFSGLFFFVFAYFREQACIAVCPYGRLQGVLLGKDSIVIAYDWLRGEPRGRKKKNQPAEQKLGDCIDCKLCVQVCPTGIDIRHGTQMECVNCTACIDACDTVMEKIKRPKGLIRFASYNGIAHQQPFRFTPRIMAYTAVLVVLMGITGFSLASRSEVEATVLRTPGMLYQRTEDGQIANLYNLQLVNKRAEAYQLEIRLISPDTGSIRWVGQQQAVPAQGMFKGAFFVDIPRCALPDRKQKIKLQFWDGTQLLDEVQTYFMAP
ncbi:MAG: cytochrome c oxidase accessory protein CcoG [Bacteroidota bacterium]